MIHQINQENPQLREMHTENIRLRVSLEDHQRALEHIMTKYREHSQLALENSKINLQEMFKGETEKSMVCILNRPHSIKIQIEIELNQFPNERILNLLIVYLFVFRFCHR